MENSLVEQRLNKLNEIKKLKINPYPYSFPRTDSAKDLQERYKHLKEEDQTKDESWVCGRIMLLRRMGKAAFVTLEDYSGQIQIYFREDAIGKPEYDLFKKVEVGDFIGVQGIIFKTKKGELTVNTKSFSLLCKATNPLPEKWHGLKDTELRYRQRYLDLIVNRDVKDVFLKRSKIIQAIREYLDNLGFIEVEIPTLQPIYGGGNAKPFKTHINAWDLDLYLSISPELYLKRLVVGGLEKVYTICKNFRNEGIDKTHNPEFTMLEFYCAYIDYNELMKIYENLWEHVAKKVLGTTEIIYQEKKISLKAPWPKLTMKDAIKKYAKVDVNEYDDDNLSDYLEENRIELPVPFNRGLAIASIFESKVEEHLIQPVHIIDHPKETTPLCKEHRQDKSLIERDEPYINGWETGNGYSELNDPSLQKSLFEEQVELGRGGNEEAHPMDEDYINALEYGLPPTAGIGLGIDRMVMLLTNQLTIRDVILFPTMKPENKD